MRRATLITAVLFTVLVLQAALVNRLPLPLGHPDLVLVCVIAVGLAAGSATGAGVGFAAGLGADVLPPADHTVGRLALTFAICGYLAGLFEDAEERSVLSTVVAVAGLSAFAVLVVVLVGALVGDHRIATSAVAHALGATVIYDVVLAPFVVPLLSMALRRTEAAG